MELGRAGLALCAAPALSRSLTLSRPEQLSTLPLIGYGDAPSTHWTLTRGDETVTEPISPRLTCNSARTATEATVAGFGILRAPLLAAGPALMAGARVRVLPDWTVPSAVVWGVYGHRRDTDATLAALIEAVRAVQWD